jgi:hypothetical protein
VTGTVFGGVRTCAEAAGATARAAARTPRLVSDRLMDAKS